MKSWSSTPSTESGRRWARWRRPDIPTQSLLSSTVPVRPSSSVTEELHDRYRSHFQFWNLLYICLCLCITYFWLLSCQNCDSIIHQINTILDKQNFLFQTNQLSYNYWCREIWLLPSPCLSYYNQVEFKQKSWTCLKYLWKLIPTFAHGNNFDIVSAVMINGQRKSKFKYPVMLIFDCCFFQNNQISRR